MAGSDHPTPCHVATHGALFLDFDGTLVDIAATPEAIVIPPGLPALLARLAALMGGATALLSGRTIGTLDHFLAPTRLAAAGGHGAELRRSPSSAIEAHVAPEVPERWFTTAAALAATRPGAIFERKPHGFTLHARGCPEALPGFAEALAALAAEDDRFALLHAHMAVEIRPAAANKGLALEALMAAPPFAGRKPVFVGDDVTDEDAIAAAERLGGEGLRVADSFGSPAGVRAWLEAIAAGRAA